MSDTPRYCTDLDNCTFGDCPSAFCDRDKKMFPVGDTPRTDAARLDERDPAMAIASECAKLERELTAAQAEIARLKAGGCARVKRLEEAGGALADSFPRTHPQHDELMNQWTKTKEAKP